MPAPSGPEAGTPLLGILRRLIGAQGPVSVAEYMALALGHPEHGYYMSRDPFGRAGDFTTAPEISQMAGELIGLWAAQVWLDQGRPDPIRLIELGPGRGTLMADALRAMAVVPGLLEALNVRLVETSPALRTRQQAALSGARPPVAWYERIDQALDGAGPVLVIANEFFDALPVHQFVRTETGWHERLIGLDDGALAFTLAPVPAATEIGIDGPPGTIVERSPAGEAIAGEIAAAIGARGGAALFIDYGPARSGSGETLQAVRGHRYHPVLEAPGEADLTAHVDFERLAQTAQAQGASAYGPMAQGALFTALGIEARAQVLRAKATPDQAAQIGSALARLTAPDQMGTLFKALAIAPRSAPPPPPFQAKDSASQTASPRPAP